MIPQTKIIFSSKGTPISDFEAEYAVLTYLYKIQNNRVNNYEIHICNHLIWELLRAAYHTTHRRLQESTTWWYETEQIDMDKHMRTDNFWKYPCTTLLEDALFKLLEPNHTV